MELRFGHLVDYATIDSRGKLILVGLFDIVHFPPGTPLALPPGFLVAKLRASALEGDAHAIEMRLTDADGADVGARQSFDVRFTAESTGPSLVAQLIIPVGGHVVPEFGEYAFRLYTAGAQLGEVAVHVMPAPDAGAGPPTA